MTRKVHGIKAGPWLGANTVVFGVAGALIPLVDVISESKSVVIVFDWSSSSHYEGNSIKVSQQ
jgi:hypothetical protein